VHGIAFLGGRVNLDVRRDAGGLQLTVDTTGSTGFDLDFAPAYPPCAQVDGATVEGSAVTWRSDDEKLDWHPRFHIPAKPGKTVLAIRHHGFFGYAVPFSSPQLGGESRNLKLISETWSENGHKVILHVSGRASHGYRLELVNGELLASVEGAKRDGNSALIIDFPENGSEYRDRQITLVLRQ